MNVPASQIWDNMRETAYTFQKSYTDKGIICTLNNIPKEGIYGNDHMMFQDLNNVVAEHLKNGL